MTGRGAAGRALVALRAILVALLLAAPGIAAAQALDYRAIFGSGGAAEAPAEETSEAAAPPVETTMVRRTAESAAIFRERLAALMRSAEGAGARAVARLEAASPDGQAGYFAGVALVTGILILIGRAFVSLYALYIARPLMVRAQQRLAPVGVSGKLPVLALRMALTAGGVAIATAVAAALGLWLVDNHAPTQVTGGIILGGYGLFILVDTAWRMILSPYLPEYRLTWFRDAAARRLYIWISFVAGFGIAARALAVWMREMGMGSDLVQLASILSGFVSLALVLAMIWANRAAISGAILHGRRIEDATWIMAAGARIWAPLVSIYFVAAWAEEAVRQVLGYEVRVPLLAGAFITLALGLVVQAIGFYAVERVFERRRALERAQSEARAREAAETAGPEPRPAIGEIAAPAPDASLEGAGVAAPSAAQGREADPAGDALPASARADGVDADGDGEEEGGGGIPPPRREPPVPSCSAQKMLA